MSLEIFIIFSTTCVGVILFSYYKTRDIFHPSVLGSIFFLGSVGGSSLSLNHANINEIYNYDFDEHSLYYLAGLMCFALGGLSLSGRMISRTHQVRELALPLTPPEIRKITKTALTLAAISWLIYLLQLRAGGGFVEVYSNAKGRGSLGSGIQDLQYLAVPAAALTMIVFHRTPDKVFYGLLVCICILPLLSFGLLSSRRGPSIQALSALFFAYYIAKGTRPSIYILTLAMFSGITLALFLVTFRTDIYLGSDIFSKINVNVIKTNINDFISRPTKGHEFIYSSFVMENSSEQQDFWYGARYVAAITLWLVPSFLFPNKYQVFGLDGMLVNGGTNGTNPIEGVETPGAAPMLMADLYVEFSYFSLIFAFILGRFLSHMWLRAQSGTGLHAIAYVCALSVLVYLFTQNFVAFAQRLVIMVVPTLIVARTLGLQLRRPSVSQVIHRSPSVYESAHNQLFTPGRNADERHKPPT